MLSKIPGDDVGSHRPGPHVYTAGVITDVVFVSSDLKNPRVQNLSRMDIVFAKTHLQSLLNFKQILLKFQTQCMKFHTKCLKLISIVRMKHASYDLYEA